MILSRSSSWMHKELVESAPSVARYCYVQDIVNMDAGRLVVSDGLHFVASTIPEQTLLRLMEGYSMESLQLKGSILLVDRHFFCIARNRIEMTMEECIYFGEGSLSGRTKDINKSVSNRNLRSMDWAMGVRPLRRSIVLRFLDQNALLDKHCALAELIVCREAKSKKWL